MTTAPVGGSGTGPVGGSGTGPGRIISDRALARIFMLLPTGLAAVLIAVVVTG